MIKLQEKLLKHKFKLKTKQKLKKHTLLLTRLDGTMLSENSTVHGYPKAWVFCTFVLTRIKNQRNEQTSSLSSESTEHIFGRKYHILMKASSDKLI